MKIKRKPKKKIVTVIGDMPKDWRDKFLTRLASDVMERLEHEPGKLPKRKGKR